MFASMSQPSPIIDAPGLQPIAQLHEANLSYSSALISAGPGPIHLVFEHLVKHLSHEKR